MLDGWRVAVMAVSVLVVSDDGGKQVDDAGGEQDHQDGDDAVVEAARFQGVFGQGRGLQDGHFFEGPGRFEPAFFKGGQGGLVEVLGEAGLHFEALVFFDGAVEGRALGRGEPGLFAGDLFFEGGDLEVGLDDVGAGRHEVAEHGGAAGLQVAEPGFHAVDDGGEVFGGALRGDEAVAVLVGEQGLAGHHGGLVDVADLFGKEVDLVLGEAVREGVHELFAVADQGAGDGVGGLGVVALGLDDEDAGVVVVFDADAVQVVGVELFDGDAAAPGPQPRQQVVARVAVVFAQVQAGVELFEHVQGQQVVAQQELVGLVAGVGAAEQAAQVEALAVVDLGALDDDVGFGDVAVGGVKAPIQHGQEHAHGGRRQHRAFRDRPQQAGLVL